MLPLRFVDRLRFFIERQFVKGAFFQLLVVAVVVGLISLTGGLLVAPFEGPFETLGQAVWWAFLRLTDPGYLGDDEGTWQRFVSTMLTVSGYVVFLGALVAIMTSWLITVMRDLERGLTPVALKNHVAILGWTSQTALLAAELMSSSGRMKRFLEKNDTQKLKLVILAEDVSAEQALELRNEPGISGRFREIIMRSGLPIQSEALHRVACLQAAAIIIPSAEHAPGELVTSDAQTVKALLSIASQARYFDLPLPFCVAELQDMRKLPVLERAYPGAVEVVAGDATISRLIAQNLIHPGLSDVYNELLSDTDGNDIYVRSGETMVGQTLQALAAARPLAIVMGLLSPAERGGWKVMLPAPGDYQVAAEDQVVMLARDYAETEPDKAGGLLPEVNLVLPSAPVAQVTCSRRVLVFGWNRRVPALLQEMGSYPAVDYTVDLISVVPADEREQAINGYLADGGEVSCRHIEADFMVESEISRLNPSEYDSIVFLSSDRVDSGEEADARVMVGYLQLEDVLERSSRRPQLIMELSDPGNRHLLTDNSSEMLISPMILSHVLAQVALRRELRVVLDDLFMAGGGEIQFRNPDDYPLPASSDFQRLEKTLAETGEVALGIWRAVPDDLGRHAVLNPSRSMRLALQSGDRLIVLARG
ncbi:CASTOR/POLLUX-related putative ion channel [Halopseudomonas salegens]|uniref:Castor and Pollux, part of voltage-gated ion channel n=1 Tax=Halopseudomonas salegens TaxID=1434072 RepID=A0A1H2E7N5_9GAMM|nr:ion channel DMI1 [Halopseudomonas salegens]SDT91202.1 Castor and Pollux, part of voltage-gated ion channel [Halopseudomonas salegens]